MRRIFLIAAVLACCASPVPATPAGTTLPSGVNLLFRTLDRGSRSCWVPPEASPIGRPHLLAFRDWRSWLDFWGQHSCGREIPAPPVGFPMRMAIAYIAGSSSGASSAEVKEIIYDRDRRLLLVQVEEDRTPLDQPQVPNPYHIVSCRNLPGEFVLHQEVRWPFRTLDIGLTSGYRYGDRGFGGENMILREEPRFLEFWDAHTSNQSPPPPPPGIDFPSEMALATMFGYWPDNGASIEIVKITTTWFGALRVEVSKGAEPGPLPALTNPFHLVATPRWEGPVFFVEAAQSVK